MANFIKTDNLTKTEFDSVPILMGCDSDWKLCEVELPAKNCLCQVLLRSGVDRGLRKTFGVFMPETTFEKPRFDGVLNSDYGSLEDVYAWKQMYL